MEESRKFTYVVTTIKEIPLGLNCSLKPSEKEKVRPLILAEKYHCKYVASVLS